MKMDSTWPLNLVEENLKSQAAGDCGKLASNRTPFCIFLRTVLIDAEQICNIEKLEENGPSNDYFEMKQFLYQLGLVDKETAQFSLQKSRDLKSKLQPLVNSRLKRMLRMKPKYYLENGKVKRYAPVKIPTKVKVKINTSAKKQFPRKKHRGNFSSHPKKPQKQKLSEPLRTSNWRQRCYLSRKAVSGIGLNVRSKRLLNLCCDLSIRVRRMTDDDIAKKMWETANSVGQHLKSRENENLTASRFKEENGKTEFTSMQNHSSHSQWDVSVDLYRMTDVDIQNKITERKELTLWESEWIC